MIVRGHIDAITGSATDLIRLRVRLVKRQAQHLTLVDGPIIDIDAARNDRFGRSAQHFEAINRSCVVGHDFRCRTPICTQCKLSFIEETVAVPSAGHVLHAGMRRRLKRRRV